MSYHNGRPYTGDDPTETERRRQAWIEDITSVLLSNMQNSRWETRELDQADIGDGWVRLFFKYPGRDVLRAPYPKDFSMRKRVDASDYALKEFYESVRQIGIERFVTLEVYDCDSFSRRADCAEYLYLSPDDFERLIKPRLVEKPDVDFLVFTGIADPDRIIMLGDTPIKQSELLRYFEIVGADTPQKRAWNTPTYEKLKRTLEKAGEPKT